MTPAARCSIHAVVRACGERTADLCLKLVRQQLPAGGSAEVVSGAPFEVTLRRCYEAAIARGARWTLTVDADVLLAPGAVATLIRRAEAMPAHYLQLEARAFDNVQGRWREVGHRIFRTELLPELLALLPAPGESIRPESMTIKRLGAAGHPSRLIDDPIGLHDFEQYRRDLYRKAFTHAHKHGSRMDAIIRRCAEHRSGDLDYLVILQGAWDGLLAEERVALDASAFQARAARALAQLGIDEKPALATGSPQTTALVAELRELTWRRHPPPIDAPRDEPDVDRGILHKTARGYRYRVRNRGLARGSLAQLGAFLRLLGDKLDR